MNYYELLELDRKASLDTIKRVYKIQIKRYHPDTVPENEKAEAEEKVKKITEAYSVLSDETKRKEYDEKLDSEEKKKSEPQESNNIQSNEVLLNKIDEYEQMLRKYAAYIENMNAIMSNVTGNNYRADNTESRYREYEQPTDEQEIYEAITFRDRLTILGNSIKRGLINILKVSLLIGIVILILMSIPSTREAIFAFMNLIQRMFS